MKLLFAFKFFFRGIVTSIIGYAKQKTKTSAKKKGKKVLALANNKTNKKQRQKSKKANN